MSSLFFVKNKALHRLIKKCGEYYRLTAFLLSEDIERPERV